jgi:hypothetical protein
MSQRMSKEESGDEAGDIFEWVSQLNLGCLSDFYESADSWFSPQADQLRDSLDVDNRSNEFGTNREQCLRYLRISVFLMLCAHLEETLYLYCKREDCDTAKGSGLDRFKDCVKKLLGGSLGTCQAWDFLKDAFKIRNALLHANGRPALMNDEDRNNIQRIVKKHNHLFHWPEVHVAIRSSFETGPKFKKSDDTRIEIIPEGLQKLSTHIQQLIHQLRPSK